MFDTYIKTNTTYRYQRLIIIFSIFFGTIVVFGIFMTLGTLFLGWCEKRDGLGRKQNQNDREKGPEKSGSWVLGTERGVDGSL